MGRGLGEPGGDLLFRVLRRSTIGAEGFHGRVRDGIGCLAPRCGHQAVAAPAGQRTNRTTQFDDQRNSGTHAIPRLNSANNAVVGTTDGFPVGGPPAGFGGRDRSVETQTSRPGYRDRGCRDWGELRMWRGKCLASGGAAAFGRLAAARRRGSDR